MKKITQNGSLIYILTIFLLMSISIICYKPSIFLCIPLLVSPAVMFLQTKVSRYAFMLGAINSILYAIAYAKMTLYATASYSVLVSFPLQLATFFNWSHHTQKRKTDLKQMSHLTLLITVMIIIGGVVLLCMIFSRLNSQYLFFDNCITILGIAATILCMLRYREYTILQILCNSISLIMFFIMLSDDPSKIIWIINASNAVICSYLALKKARNHKK